MLRTWYPMTPLQTAPGHAPIPFSGGVPCPFPCGSERPPEQQVLMLEINMLHLKRVSSRIKQGTPQKVGLPLYWKVTGWHVLGPTRPSEASCSIIQHNTRYIIYAERSEAIKIQWECGLLETKGSLWLLLKLKSLNLTILQFQKQNFGGVISPPAPLLLQACPCPRRMPTSSLHRKFAP